MIHRIAPAENERISNAILGAKDSKETGGSNPLRSSNESMRTVGLVHVFEGNEVVLSSVYSLPGLPRDFAGIASNLALAL